MCYNHSVMAMTREEILADALELSADELTLPVSPLLASLPTAAATPRSLLDLAGRGEGIWADDSTIWLERHREEWR